MLKRSKKTEVNKNLKIETNMGMVLEKNPTRIYSRTRPVIVHRNLREKVLKYTINRMLLPNKYLLWEE